MGAYLYPKAVACCLENLKFDPDNSMPSNFAISSAKYVLLTYSQIDRDHQDVPEEQRPSRTLHRPILRLVQSIQAECIIGRENHGDGGKHLHVFIAFKRRFSTRNPRYFDVEGFHPNIKRVGYTPWKSYDYAIKDGDIVGGELKKPEKGECEPGPPARDADWTWITDAETRDEFFIRIRQRRPRELVCNFAAIMRYADWQYREDPAEYSHPENVSFQLDDYPELSDWAWANLGYSGGRSSSPDWPTDDITGPDDEEIRGSPGAVHAHSTEGSQVGGGRGICSVGSVR